MTSVPRTLEEGNPALPGVRNAVAVASGKGGVGKSTVSVNLALSLARGGARVGLLDGDIYGPSLPLMLGVRQEPQPGPGQRMLPVRSRGLWLMSIGFLAGEDAPVVWRGPLLAQALQQFVANVEWGALDYLVIDLPPGTGDVPLTLAQTVALSGAVMVTTPQDVALQDVERGIAMFHKVGVEVLGIVENMSYYACPQCGERHEVFGQGGGQQAAARLALPLLAQIPLYEGIRRGGDEGQPVCLVAPDSEEARLFAGLADGVVEQLRRTAAQT
ncbi:MAG: Mrp/NBP35 family ATP-binding protein [Candidatus Latescibacterota bacterium]